MQLQPESLNGLDYLLLAYFALGALSGFRVGFVGAVVGATSLVGSWLVAGLLTGRVAAFLDSRWQLVERLRATLERTHTLPTQAVNLEDPSAIVHILPLADAYQQALLRVLQQAASSSTAQGGEGVALTLDYLLALAVVNIGVFLGLFVLTRGVWALAGGAVSALLDLGPLRPLNRLLGAALGLLRNAAVATLGLGLLIPILGIVGVPWLTAAIDRSAVAAVLLHGFYRLSPWLFR